MNEKTHDDESPPDAQLHRSDVEYARELFAKLSAAGISQRQAARQLGLSDRILRAYSKGEQTMPYTVQYTIEALANRFKKGETASAVQEARATYGPPKSEPRTVWHEASERPLGAGDVGKLVVGKDRFGVGIFGVLERDSFGLVIKEIHPQAVDVHSVPVDRVQVYTLLDPY